MYHGILNVYKEPGFTSFDVVAKLRGILKQKKIGHTGTLDPQAEGVLVVCLGKATKLCDILPDHDKEYEATLLLGTTTDTEDTTGTVLTEQLVNGETFTREEVEEAIMSFVGDYDQIPPMYSAIKVDGKKLYELAREGQVIERKPRPVTIHKIEIVSVDLPRVVFRISCSRGTYIRSLCRDIGEKLQCGGCMERLVRSRACGFQSTDSLTLAQIEALTQGNNLESQIHSIDSMYPEYPRIIAKPEVDRLLYNGNKFRKSQIQKLTEGSVCENDEQERSESRFLVYDSKQQFIGIYSYDISKKEFVPYKVFLPI